MKRRVILIVMDSLGVGSLPDAARFGDDGADTFGHIADELKDKFAIPHLARLGFGNIQGLHSGKKDFAVAGPCGCFGKAAELSNGKDTVTGHWEIAGIETKVPFKTYPDGFPADFIRTFEKEIGTAVIGNYAESGTVIIERLGEEHEKTGHPIVYTSNDSVFQIAANVDVIPPEKLYAICETARRLLVGDWACGRVIARPYKIIEGKRVRTADRRDYAVAPPEETLLDRVKASGQTVYAVGKISDIFDGHGVSVSVHTKDNMDGVDRTLQAMRETENGLIFTNLVDFDSLYGHRRNPAGYGKALMELDDRVPELSAALQEKDILIFCADHGNDPVWKGYNHTREYVPIVATGAPVRAGADLGVRSSFADIGQSIAAYLGTDALKIGKSFLPLLLR